MSQRSLSLSCRLVIAGAYLAACDRDPVSTVPRPVSAPKMDAAPKNDDPPGVAARLESVVQPSDYVKAPPADAAPPVFHRKGFAMLLYAPLEEKELEDHRIINERRCTRSSA